MKSIFHPVIVAACVALAGQALAESYVINVDGFEPAGSPGVSVVSVEVGALIGEVSSVTVRATGVGTGALYECLSGSAADWYDHEIAVHLGGRSFHIQTEDGIAFDDFVTKSEWTEHPDYPIAGVAVLELGLSAGPGLAAEFLECEAEGVLLPVVSSIEITIEASSVVGAASTSWGAIKALYR